MTNQLINRDACFVRQHANPEHDEFVIPDCPMEMRNELFRRLNAYPALLAERDALRAACKSVADRIQGGDRFESIEPWAQEVVSELRAALAHGAA